MENQVSPKSNAPSDEIDLGQLLQMIRNGLHNLFKSFLRFFVYLKRNSVKLLILLVVGLAIGIGLNQIVTKSLKTEVIVKPNLESKNYLYDVINEIQSNVIAKDTMFFSAMGINVENLKGFKISVAPVDEKMSDGNIEDELKYIELLEKFRNDDLITDVLRTEILNKSILNHRITFTYKDAAIGNEYARKLMDYINSNNYFKEVVAINLSNARERIVKNEDLVAQIDGLVQNYAEKIASKDEKSEGRIILDTEEQLDITGLLNLKNNLIRDIESKKLELQQQKEAIRVINFGRPQEVQKTFFARSMVLIPLLLVGIFILMDILKYFNRKAKELEL